MEMKVKTGVLLVNVGTPDAPETKAVRRYLKEFLSDPRVIDIPAVIRFFLLRCIILPFRSPKSAHAYKSIWSKEHGSPLLMYSKQLGTEVGKLLGDDYLVEVSMRYQNPSIDEALAKLNQAGVGKIIVFPLFPQYSSAATGTVFEKVSKLIHKMWNIPQVVYVPPFYDDPLFIESFSAIAKNFLANYSADFVLFSYHGLPERHVKKSDLTKGKFCLTKDNCCEKIEKENQFCYRAQCFATTRLLAKKLNLSPQNYTTSFQSRLGKDPWIKPYTDLLLQELADKGYKKIAVFCPAFVADCLETLEEIQMRAREQWLEIGGEDLRLIPSLNADSNWAQSVVKMIQKYA
ncbi:ferrochelatase [Pigmentibacter sp. JX0631]|uniref:ferrochelatase n=1 Tax=Pigmentibacter sp. JX0631 TaxID=2976982 RepID=UPI002468C4A5|nr:ferrochelatase [Pigmentibacter sp. JX0631]WGL59632.1 ferrochelatase [Pigmentibacter sp. JX0631]